MTSKAEGEEKDLVKREEVSNLTKKAVHKILGISLLCLLIKSQSPLYFAFLQTYASEGVI